MTDAAGAATPRRVAFLRGINLGGRRLKMDELQTHFEAMGLAEVATYLASGNIIFAGGGGALADLEAEIEAGLESRLGYEVDTFVRTLPELASLPVLGELDALNDEGFKPHIIFLKSTLGREAKEAFAALETHDDAFRSLGREVLWLRRGGLSDSDITTADLRRALGGRTSTMRTANTVSRIVAKFRMGC